MVKGKKQQISTMTYFIVHPYDTFPSSIQTISTFYHWVLKIELLQHGNQHTCYIFNRHNDSIGVYTTYIHLVRRTHKCNNNNNNVAIATALCVRMSGKLSEKLCLCIKKNIMCSKGDGKGNSKSLCSCLSLMRWLIVFRL